MATLQQQLLFNPDHEHRSTIFGFEVTPNQKCCEPAFTSERKLPHQTHSYNILYTALRPENGAFSGPSVIFVNDSIAQSLNITANNTI